MASRPIKIHWKHSMLNIYSNTCWQDLKSRILSCTWAIIQKQPIYSDDCSKKAKWNEVISINWFKRMPSFFTNHSRMDDLYKERYWPSLFYCMSSKVMLLHMSMSVLLHVRARGGGEVGKKGQVSCQIWGILSLPVWYLSNLYVCWQKLEINVFFLSFLEIYTIYRLMVQQWGQE